MLNEFKLKGTLLFRVDGTDVDHELGEIEIPIRVTFDGKPAHFANGGTVRGTGPGITTVKQTDTIDRSR